MKSIELLSIEKSGNALRYNFQYSPELGKYFTGEDFLLEYSQSIEEVPDGVLAIPFISNVLPISWMTNCELIVPELEQDFYNSIPQFLQGFENMFPETAFAGKLTVANIRPCKPVHSGGSATLFSGGLDATTTLLRHMDEHPHLISIWGSDVDFNNTEGWQIVESGLKKAAQQYGLPLGIIRSNFRRFDDSIKLTEDFGQTLQTSWWYGLKHGLGLIGHAAPYVWLYGINTLYIASTNSPERGKVRCASDPTTDSKIAFCGCAVSHDAYELNRQKKTHFVANYHRSHPDIPIHLRVCWKSSSGTNCCSCEKCYRTMTGLWIEGEEPKEYGFDYDGDVLTRMYQTIALRYTGALQDFWIYLQDGLRERWDDLEGTWYRDQMKWILDFDFEHPEENECRKKYRETWNYKGKIVKAFPRLYKLYVKFRGYRFE